MLTFYDLIDICLLLSATVLFLAMFVYNKIILIAVPYKFCRLVSKRHSLLLDSLKMLFLLMYLDTIILTINLNKDDRLFCKC